MENEIILKKSFENIFKNDFKEFKQDLILLEKDCEFNKFFSKKNTISLTKKSASVLNKNFITRDNFFYLEKNININDININLRFFALNDEFSYMIDFYTLPKDRLVILFIIKSFFFKYYQEVKRNGKSKIDDINNFFLKFYTLESEDCLYTVDIDDFRRNNPRFMIFFTSLDLFEFFLNLSFIYNNSNAETIITESDDFDYRYFKTVINSVKRKINIFSIDEFNDVLFDFFKEINKDQITLMNEKLLNALILK
jgi:hypothetical protein